MQQGRVELDADGNEQIAIDAYREEVTNTDVIGTAGYPAGTAPDGTALGGFALALTSDRKDVTISPGRMYVDGLLVENSAAATLLAQPGLPGASTPADVGAGAPGVYLAYLEVFERLVTALDDPAIRESALGGPDTSVRSQTVWQVRLAYVGAAPADPAQLPGCGDVDLSILPAAPTGTLTASTASSSDPMPCMLPPDSGYQRLENQLYRVEVHTPGADGTATFKWSRENGSVLALITAPAGSGSAPTTASGPEFTVTGLKDDPTLGLQAGDWVELTDDATELSGQPGSFYRVAVTPTDGRTVVIDGAPTVTLALRPKLRRWDQSGAAYPQGVPITAGTPIPLEGGVQVAFSSGTYRTGDYWLIPARTATSIEQGHVEWPADHNGQALAQAPAGVALHFAKLGLLEYTADRTFSGLGASPQPTDCRLPFWPLTDLAPGEYDGPCTIVARPGPGWEVPIVQWFSAAKEKKAPQDAEICFPVGDYPIAGALRIEGAGHVRISGAGWGTRLLATGDSETVLAFGNCASVAVRDLYASTTHVLAASAGKAAGSRIAGTIEFSNCGSVVVQDAWIRCGGSPSRRGAACITVASDVSSATRTTGAGSATIRGCRLHPGEMQVGLQLVHLEDAIVEDNEIAIDPDAAPTTLPTRLRDPGYLAIARSHLYSHLVGSATAVSKASAKPAADATAKARPASAQPASPQAVEAWRPEPDSAPAAEPESPAAAAPQAPAGPPPELAHAPDVWSASPVALAKTPIQLQIGDQTFSALTDRALTTTLQAYLRANAPKTFATQTDARNYLRKAADTILTEAGARAGYSAFSSILRSLYEHVPLAGRGVCYGGQGLGRLVISGNRISGVLMGLSVGVSHRASAPETSRKQRTPDRMKIVRVVGNTITCLANDVAAKQARFGIFVGNADSVEIEGNTLHVQPAGFVRSVPPADAVRVVGYLGPRLIIRGNYARGFTMGIRVMPLVGDGPGQRAPEAAGEAIRQGIRAGNLWLVADNVIAGASASATIGPFEPTKNPSFSPGSFIDAWACLLLDNTATA